MQNLAPLLMLVNNYQYQKERKHQKMSNTKSFTIKWLNTEQA